MGRELGRPKGAENKNKRVMRELLEMKYPGYEPVLSMAEAALEITDRAKRMGPGLAAVELWEKACEAHNKVAKYVTPQLAAVKVEVGQSDNSGVLVVPSSPQSLVDWQQQAQDIMRRQAAVIEHEDVQ